MTAATQLIKNAMPELRSRYVARLRAQSGELLDFISRCERGKLTDEACDATRALVHSLRGTGTTFGFAEISEAAKYLEDALDCGPPRNTKTYIRLALELIRACDVDESTPAPIVETVEQPPDLSDAAVERPLLLTVSDDPATAALVAQMFETRMQVVATADLEEATEIVRSGNPSVVLFDMQTQHATAAMERLYRQTQSKDAAMIAIAPTRQAAAVAHAISGGHIQCLVKPLSVEKLYNATHATLERGRLVVLIGDDDIIVREMIATRFKSFGFSVLGAGDGSQVLDLAARHQPSVIVLDRIMPGIEGVAILRMLKANPTTHEIPVIMLSAKRLPSEIVEARRAGAADYIIKPFKPDQVVFRCMREIGVPTRSITNVEQFPGTANRPLKRLYDA